MYLIVRLFLWCIKMDVDLEIDEIICIKMKFYVKRECRMYSMLVGYCKFKFDIGILKDYMEILFFVIF